MLLPIPALLLPLLTTAYILPPSLQTTTTYPIPSIHDSAILARRILHLESIGTLSTTFPSQQNLLTTTPQTALEPLENRPQDLSSLPIGLMDYISDCEPSTGNPTILAISIATSFKNTAAGSNITLSLRWHPPSTWRNGGAAKYSAASLPRFSLVGYLEELTAEEVESQDVAGCFLGYHPDAVAWLPGNRIHESRWVRLVVREVYWIGGFGDRAYIGWIPREVWGNVTVEEVGGVRLPGETGGFGFSWW